MSITPEVIYNLLKKVSDTVDETKEEIRVLRAETRTEIEYLKETNRKLESEISNLKTKLNSLERKHKKYNIIIYGLKEENKDEQEVLKIFNEILEIDCKEENIRDIYRIGNPANRNRKPIVVEFLRQSLKKEVLSKLKDKSENLKKLGVAIALDQTAEDYSKNKYLYTHFKAARDEGNTAKIRNFNLIVNGRTYSINDLKAKESLNSTEHGNGNKTTLEENMNKIPDPPSTQENKKKLDETNHKIGVQGAYKLRDRKASNETSK